MLRSNLLFWANTVRGGLKRSCINSFPSFTCADKGLLTDLHWGPPNSAAQEYEYLTARQKDKNKNKIVLVSWRRFRRTHWKIDEQFLQEKEMFRLTLRVEPRSAGTRPSTSGAWTPWRGRASQTRQNLLMNLMLIFFWFYEWAPDIEVRFHAQVKLEWCTSFVRFVHFLEFGKRYVLCQILWGGGFWEKNWKNEGVWNKWGGKLKEKEYSQRWGGGEGTLKNNNICSMYPYIWQ